MQFLFEDPSFSFETLRAMGFAVDGGADLADVLVTASAIREGDEVSWHREWKNTAQRVHHIAEECLTKGHSVSAREAFLRASNYYRMAEFYLREDPNNTPEVVTLSNFSRETFLKAAQLMDAPVEEVLIPYEGTTLPAYMFQVDNSGQPRPIVIYNNGFDSTREEAYCAVAAAALRRGYNVLAFDGPGQGSALREQGLVFRPDWEHVVTPVLDYAISRPEVANDKIVMFGYSLGALLIARAAAFDPRPAALILDDGMIDFFEANITGMPPFMVEWLTQKQDEAFIPVAHMLMSRSTSIRWSLQNGVWTFGASSVAEYLRKTSEYTLKGILDKITTPTLVLDAADDYYLKGQPQQVANGLTCPNTLITLTAEEGAAEHCHMGAMRRLHQVMFDWLDELM